MNKNLPNFLCVGASKTGTSSMHQILKQHSQIFLPDEKETNFFHKNYDKGIDWYKEYYKNVKNETAIGEICPTYIYNKKSPERIYNELGKDIKLIFIFRNPADKMFSNYKMNIAIFDEKNSFKDAIELDKQRIKNNENYHVAYHYIKKGFYNEQVKQYLKFFPKKNMLFLIYEKNFKQNSENTYKKIQEFLNIDYEKLFLDIKNIPGQGIKNKNIDKIINTPNKINQFAKKLLPSKKLRMKIKNLISKKNKKQINVDNSQLEEMRSHLINDIYKESITELEQIIEQDLKHWLI